MKINRVKLRDHVIGQPDTAQQGEEFRSEVLTRFLTSTIWERSTLVIDLDGFFGYTPNFLRAAFSMPISGLDKEHFLRIVSFISGDQPGLIKDIEDYMTTNEEES